MITEAVVLRARNSGLENTVNGMVVRCVLFDPSRPLGLRRMIGCGHWRLKVSRVTVEVGSKGTLGSQTHVPGIEGVC